MLQGCYSQKSGILHDHLVVLYHIQERYDQLAVLYSDDLIYIFLDIWENLIARAFNRSTIRNGVHSWKSHYMSCF